MPRFFVDSSAFSDGKITVRGDDAVHIGRVLRMKPGESLTVCDEYGVEYACVIAAVGQEILLDALSSKLSENEPPYRATVYQSLVRSERFDTVLMKATELGVSSVVPVIASRCTIKLEPREYAKKRERWQRILSEAAKQCGRGAIPRVCDPMPFSDAVKDAAKADLPLFCYEAGGTAPLPEICSSVPSPGTVSVFIGPEGGFEQREADEAAAGGMRMTGLGNRILRTETAAPYVLACLSFRYELPGGSSL